MPSLRKPRRRESPNIELEAGRAKAQNLSLRLPLPTQFLLATSLLWASGCYLSHRVEAGPDASARDASARDASARDAGSPDATARVDASARECTGIRVAASVALDDGTRSGITPRLVGLPGGELAIVYVSTDGSPTRVRYERLSAGLERLHSATVATDSFTWAEPVFRDGEIFIAYGLAGDEGSVLQQVTFGGEPRGPRQAVPLLHPSVLRGSSGGFFWMAFNTRSDNLLLLAHLDDGGAISHPPVEVALGRYGSGHGAIARPDGHSHVFTYPREGPSGVRQGYVNALSEDGVLGPERRLGDDGDALVLPVRQGDSLVLVRHGDALNLERTDFESLERLERRSFPALPSRPFLVGAVAGRVLVGHIAEGELRVDDFGTELDDFARLGVRGPHRAGGPGGSVLEVPGALYVAIGLIDATRQYPYVVRLECSFE